MMLSSPPRRRAMPNPLADSFSPAQLMLTRGNALLCLIPDPFLPISTRTTLEEHAPKYVRHALKRGSKHRMC